MFLLILVLLFFSHGQTYAATYWVAPDGNDSNPGTEQGPWKSPYKAGSAANTGDTVYFKAGTYAGPLVVENSGKEGKWITFSAAPGDERKAIILGGKHVKGSISIVGKDYIRVQNFRVQDAPDVGIFTLGKSSNIEIVGNHIFHSYSSAISAWGVVWRHDPTVYDYKGVTSILIADNEIEKANDGGHSEMITLANGVDCFEIRNNFLHNPGSSTHGGEGIDLKEGVSNGTIHHNRLEGILHRGIYIDGGRGGGNGYGYYQTPTVKNVDIFQNYVNNTDAAGISIVTEGVGDVKNIRVFNNISARSKGPNILVYKHPEGSGALDNIKIINNVAFGGRRAGILINHPHATNVTVRNNISFQNKGRNYKVEAKGSGFMNSHNLVDKDPLFVDPSAGDFRIKPGSPAIDAGTSVDAPAFDYADVNRRQGAAVDVGAYELSNKRGGE